MDTAEKTQTLTLSYLAEQIVATEHARINSGNTRSFIQCIKLFRSITGVDLKTAKDYCDAAVRTLQIGERVEQDCEHCQGKGYRVTYQRGW